jgi:hypothetical protein
MAEAPSPAADAALRTAWDGLEAACAATGASVADRMAWRSMCAPGWWADIRPAPPGEGRADTAWSMLCSHPFTQRALACWCQSIFTPSDGPI